MKNGPGGRARPDPGGEGGACLGPSPSIHLEHDESCVEGVPVALALAKRPFASAARRRASIAVPFPSRVLALGPPCRSGHPPLAPPAPLDARSAWGPERKR